MRANLLESEVGFPATVRRGEGKPSGIRGGVPTAVRRAEGAPSGIRGGVPTAVRRGEGVPTAVRRAEGAPSGWCFIARLPESSHASRIQTFLQC